MSRGRSATVNVTASMLAPRMAITLPQTSPIITASGNAVVNTVLSELPLTLIPAANSADTGTATAADHAATGARAGSQALPPRHRPGRTRVIRPSATPATVAWMPAECTATQVINASGT